jgi:FkbM family methyltransferase
MINFSAVTPNTVLGKIVRYPFRILPRNIVLPVFQGPMRGVKWIVGSHIHGCWLGSYELEMQKCMAKHVNRGDVFFDVGANVGFYSVLAARLTDPALVYSFEPLPMNLSYLHQHVELNGITNIKIVAVAISDEVGTAFFEVGKTRAMGRLRESGDLCVRTSTLDALLSEDKLAPPNCIKMDIEGAEFQALLGARRCFTRYRPKLFLATHGNEVHEACCRILHSWNYEIQPASAESGNSSELFAFPKLSST